MTRRSGARMACAEKPCPISLEARTGMTTRRATAASGSPSSFLCPLPLGMPWGAPRGSRDTPELRRRAVTAAAVAASGERAARPINYVEKDWMNEPFIAGAHGGLPPGLLTQTGPRCRSRTGPLHWCSTEPATRWALTMNGALESGERVAGDVKALL